MGARKLQPNPAWVTSALADHFEILERKVPPQWLPQLASVRARRGKLVASIDEFGCGAYGCVIPTLDAGTVCKVTTDDTEAEFAATLAHTLVAPICVEYKMVVRLSVKHEGRTVQLLWREEADRVGKIDEDLGIEVEDFIVAQHQAAQKVFHDVVTNHGAGVEPLLVAWKSACREMARVPELEPLASGMLEVFEQQRVFFGDVHAGNLGLVHRSDGSRWVITDPGHVAVIGGTARNPAEPPHEPPPAEPPKPEWRLVRTKSGGKVHLAGKGSVQTWCGIRHAGPIRLRPGLKTEFCERCGLGGMDTDTAIKRYG